MREHGYRATTAADAQVARKVMKSAGIDLVVLDIMMPGEDGLSLCRYIRESSQTPVILLTARNEEVDRIVGLEMGAYDYIAKPFSPRELIARVAAVLALIGVVYVRVAMRSIAADTAKKRKTWKNDI